MYSRYLFIGLGGSGGKTLRFLKKDIKKWMERSGIENPKIPTGWQFLHIDTPTNPDGEELNSLVPQISADEYLGLIGQNLEIDQVQQALFLRFKRCFRENFKDPIRKHDKAILLG